VFTQRGRTRGQIQRFTDDKNSLLAILLCIQLASDANCLSPNRLFIIFLCHVHLYFVVAVVVLTVLFLELKNGLLKCETPFKKHNTT